MNANEKLTHAVDLMESPTFRTLVANWDFIKISHKTEYEIQFAIASSGGAVMKALDEGRISFGDESGSRYFCESLFWASQPKQAAKT